MPWQQYAALVGQALRVPLGQPAYVDPRVAPSGQPSPPQALAPDGYRILHFDGGLHLYRHATPYAERGNTPVTRWWWTQAMIRLPFAPESVGTSVVASVLRTLPARVRDRVVLDLRPTRPPSLVELRTLVIRHLRLRQSGPVVLPASLGKALRELSRLSEFGTEEVPIAVIPIDAGGSTTFVNQAVEYWFFHDGEEANMGISALPYGLTAMQHRGAYEIGGGWVIEPLGDDLWLHETSTPPELRPEAGQAGVGTRILVTTVRLGYPAAVVAMAERIQGRVPGSFIAYRRDDLPFEEEEEEPGAADAALGAALGEADRAGSEALAVSFAPPGFVLDDTAVAGSVGRILARADLTSVRRVRLVVAPHSVAYLVLPEPMRWWGFRSPVRALGLFSRLSDADQLGGHVYELRGSPHRFLALDRATADTTDPDVAAALSAGQDVLLRDTAMGGVRVDPLPGSEAHARWDGAADLSVLFHPVVRPVPGGAADQSAELRPEAQRATTPLLHTSRTDPRLAFDYGLVPGPGGRLGWGERRLLAAPEPGRFVYVAYLPDEVRAELADRAAAGSDADVSTHGRVDGAWIAGAFPVLEGDPATGQVILGTWQPNPGFGMR